MTVKSAISAVWSWGNSVPRSADARGDGFPDMTPAAIRDFARLHALSTVQLSVPWAADQGGPIGAWLVETTTLLRSAGIRVTALGGDRDWLTRPESAAAWASAAVRSASFDGIQLDVEPWVTQPDPVVYIPQLEAIFRAVRASVPGKPLGSDLPWWLVAHFEALLPQLDSVAIIAFSDHAAGPGGIIELATPACEAASRAGRPFTIGLETDTPEVAGGAQYTFHDEGSIALEHEAHATRRAVQHLPGYRGIAVEHLRSWRALRPGRLEPSPPPSLGAPAS